MLTSLIQAIAALLAGGSSLAVATTQAPPTYDQLRQTMADQLPVAVTPTDPIGTTVSQWRALRDANGNASFFDYANFMLAHPGWPGESAFRTAAERRMAAGGWSPALAVSFFRRFPPQSGVAATRYAQALQATGQSADAVEAARAAWARGALSAEDEAALLSQFGGQFSPADHDRRMDALLWQGGTTAAARILPLTSPQRRDLFAARLAFRTNAPDAAVRANQSFPQGDADAGYLADKANWLKLTGATATARTLLANRPALVGKPGSPEKWFTLLLETAKGASAEGQDGLAVRIAGAMDDAYAPGVKIADRGYGERDVYTNLAWFAGQTALRKVARPADAIALFDAYSRGSYGPSVQARGLYWAGRAAEAAGRREGANAYYDRVSTRFADQFYGQLAAERLGRTLQAPPVVTDKPVDRALREAFFKREIVRAAQYLGATGDHLTQSLFIVQIAAETKTDADHALANQLAIALNRPDLGVRVGRSALQNGLSDFRASGYPSVKVPAGKESEFTIIHAIARQESQFDRAAVSRVGARGLMQLMPGTAREQAGKIGLAYDPAALTNSTDYNIQLGSSYFQRVYSIYNSYPLAVAAYNAGPGNVNKWLRANGDPRTGAIDMIDWIEAIPYEETRNYVLRVLENAVVYDLLHPDKSRSSGNSRLSWYLGRPPGA